MIKITNNFIEQETESDQEKSSLDKKVQQKKGKFLAKEKPGSKYTDIFLPSVKNLKIF